MSNDLQHTCRTHISSGLQENPSHLGGGGGGSLYKINTKDMERGCGRGVRDCMLKTAELSNN